MAGHVEAIKRVAARYLLADAISLAEIERSLVAIQAWVRVLELHEQVLNALIAAGEARRLGRTDGIQIAKVSLIGSSNNPSAIVAKVQGQSDMYLSRITILPKRGHYCSCPDWEQNGRQVGPCKHVLALGKFWQAERVWPAMNHVKLALSPLASDLNFG